MNSFNSGSRQNIAFDKDTPCYVDPSSQIGENSKIYPFCFIGRNVEIGKNSTIYPFCHLENCKIGDDCKIYSSFLENCIVENNCQIGPYAHLRPDAKIDNNCKIGNFVEVKNSTVKSGSKASHLSYIGDCKIGKNCNIGCGVIFANYDGKEKHSTSVGDNCFVGSNSNVIAPVNVAPNTYICAGTTLTKDTSQYDFVIARARETIKPDLAKKYLKQKKA